jgi:hypothetical protein
MTIIRIATASLCSPVPHFPKARWPIISAVRPPGQSARTGCESTGRSQLDWRLGATVVLEIGQGWDRVHAGRRVRRDQEARVRS